MAGSRWLLAIMCAWLAVQASNGAQAQCLASNVRHKPVWHREGPALRTGADDTTRLMAAVAGIREQVGLSRFTTIGTGGPARFFAEPASLEELSELLRWARAAGHAVETIGL